jgi:RNA polymerase sigma-70 factor, ECF subfamily
MALVRRAEPEPLNVGVVPPPSLPAAPGGEELFSKIYEQAAPRCLDHAERYLSRSEARDIVADGFGEIWESWPRLTVEQRTVAYCLGAIHHHILAHLRQNRRLVSLEDAEAELTHLAIHEIDTPTRVTTAEDIMDLAINRMPPQRRSVFLLLREGLPYKEICEQLSMSIGTVNTHVRLARGDIRAAAERHGGFHLFAGHMSRLAPGSLQSSQGATDA